MKRLNTTYERVVGSGFQPGPWSLQDAALDFKVIVVTIMLLFVGYVAVTADEGFGVNHRWSTPLDTLTFQAAL